MINDVVEQPALLQIGHQRVQAPGRAAAAACAALEVVAVRVPAAGRETGGDDRHARLDQPAGLQEHPARMNAGRKRPVAVAGSRICAGSLLDVERVADLAGGDDLQGPGLEGVDARAAKPLVSRPPSQRVEGVQQRRRGFRNRSGADFGQAAHVVERLAGVAAADAKRLVLDRRRSRPVPNRRGCPG